MNTFEKKREKQDNYLFLLLEEWKGTLGWQRQRESQWQVLSKCGLQHVQTDLQITDELPYIYLSQAFSGRPMFILKLFYICPTIMESCRHFYATCELSF